ncbi:type IV secretion system DNA-binding domain-containing protein [Vibrio parahaemolyticus]|uniref:type IV secretion system DNA-binding domain-containing protein n=1 Tax=Vibrio parahaemolyticus TaxID=670 RepID=UPI00186A3DDC|nr:type IV secretion system DNA-binding domain-containing protein [Vibrio parahaemolyticus]EKA7393677.1 type IV secretion system DNA-binding domain-containing protein [Vibrio parahaemolyticus]MBE4214187.1 type IV secretion system DNA-binding domain-containing protein [Vibrio parahaemolyticus]MCR9980214.1 type IV secretion system DNA-binding domain-containing protein [Vibrio parahaemolyticus]
MINSTQRYQLWPQMGMVFLVSSSGLTYLKLWLLYGGDISFALVALTEGKSLCYIAITTSIILGAFIAYKLLYVAGGREPVVHLSGPVRLKGRFAKQHAKKKFKSKVTSDSMGRGIYLHPDIQILMRQELANLLLFGQQGSGKSAIFKPRIHFSRQRGDQVFIYDRKNEYTPLFFDKDSVLISPFDCRSAMWDLSKDVQTEQDALLIAQCLIEETDDPLWSTGARLLLTGYMMILLNVRGKCSWYSLAGLLSKPENELLPMLRTHYPQAAVFIGQNSKTTQGFLVTLMKELHWLRQLRAVWRPRATNSFSINDWVENKSTTPGTLIIAHDESSPELSSKICNAMFSLMVSRVLVLDDSDERRIWFCLDELSSLTKNDSLEKWLRLGRSKGARTIAGVQSISQIRSIYGADVTETLLNLFGNVIALRMGASGESAKYASAAFGEHQVERQLLSRDDTGRRSVSTQVSYEPLVRPEDLVSLEYSSSGVSGFMSIQGWGAVYEMHWPFVDIPVVADAVVKQKSLEGKKPNKNKKIGKNRLRRSKA